VSVERPQQCEECGSPVAEDQRYCLVCGARVGERTQQLEELLRRVDGGPPRQPAATDGESPAATEVSAPAQNANAALSPSGLRLPSRPVSALLVLVFLGFGVLLGNAAGSRVSDTLASSRAPLKVVLPSAGAPAASTSTSATTAKESGAGGSGSESSGLETEAEPTPTPAAGAKTTTTTAQTTSGSTGSAGTESEASGSEKGPTGSQGAGSESSAEGALKKLPPIKHVWLIMLSDEPYASVFGPASTAPYLSGTLEHHGELLARYDAVAHEELADEIALLSGQGPTTETAANCPNYTEIAASGTGPEEQVLGSGCVYPSSTQTLPGELSAKHLTWRAYVQGIDEAGTQAGACAHPTLGQPDPSAEQNASTGPYATFRNPFVYLASVVDSSSCASDDVGLSALKANLASVNSTPSFSYIAPDRCDDGNPTPCTPGAPAGLVPADALLKQVVPEITRSKAYKESGLLVITVDEAPSSGAFADSSSCCGEPLFPNDPVKTLAGAPRGGGTVGALLLSPYVKGGTVSQEEFNHFSLLRTIEDLFSLKHLGYAGSSTVKSLEPSMFIAKAKG
jgi:phosphatidylinositol-3-phosphatase